MTTYYANEKIDYGKKPGKIASPMIYRPKEINPLMVIYEENDEWLATYNFYRTSYGFGEDVYLLDTVRIKW